ncbi:hypothetical protein EON64_20195, partial [archaeon]
MAVQIPYTRQALSEVAGRFADPSTSTSTITEYGAQSPSLCNERWSLALAKAAYDRTAHYLLTEHRALLTGGG